MNTPEKWLSDSLVRRLKSMKSRTYIDFEFNGQNGVPFTLGLCSSDGRSAYYGFLENKELMYSEEIDPWIKENVVSVVDRGPGPITWLSRREIQAELYKYFANDHDPVIIADWPSDQMLFADLLMTGPGYMAAIESFMLQLVRVDPWPNDADWPGKTQHNALWDAYALQYLIESKL